ncbi:MAG: HAMP domain-containing histidine kinase [Dehalococcoidales bacterium]|nr:HAMP domain-containing histidine kinase [Dehalococcoidales bacterium]
MTIRRKILISTILMVCVPVVFAFILWFGYIKISEINTSVSDMNRYLYVYESGISQIDFSKLSEQPDSSPDELPDVNKKIISELNDMGYHIEVIKDDNVIFSNLTEEDRETVLHIYPVNPKVTKRLLQAENKIVINDSINNTDGQYDLTSVYDKDLIDTGTFQSIIPIYMLQPSSIFIFVIVLLMVTILTGVLLSQWLGTSVLRPLEIIRSGAKEIAGGNLDTVIKHDFNDEFGDVCKDFDTMRSILNENESAKNEADSKRRLLLSGISHDIRSPLTSIKGYAMGLKDGIANTEEKKQHYYDAILTKSDDIERMTISLSELIKLEDVDKCFHLEEESTDAFITEMLNEHSSYLHDKDVEVQFEPDARDMSVLLDKKELPRVFMNLFENTIKYRNTNRSKVLIKTTLDNINDTVIIDYIDDGPGVAPDALPHIFDTFFRADKARTNPANGSGLGLAIVKRIIEGHNGKVEAVSQNGLDIKITLPVARED